MPAVRQNRRMRRPERLSKRKPATRKCQRNKLLAETLAQKRPGVKSGAFLLNTLDYD